MTAPDYPAPAKRGPGRPKKVPTPVELTVDHQVENATALAKARRDRNLAAATFNADPTATNETAMQVAEIVLAGAWVAYLQGDGNHGHALKYSDIAIKWSARLADSRYLVGLDQLDALEKVKARPVGALGKKGKK